MRLLNDGICPPEINMARDGALLQAFLQEGTPPVLRIYQWRSPAITYGIHQRLPDFLVRETQRLGIPLFRRPTGGKAVLHGHDLTVALVWQPQIDRPYPSAVYRAVMPAFLSAFRRLGIPAGVGNEKAGAPSSLSDALQDGGDCFARATPADVVHADTGIKLMGCALRVLSEATLLQASIPLTAPSVPVERLFGHPHPTPPPLDAEVLAQALYERLQELL